MEPEDQAVLRSVIGHVITVTEVTKREVKFKYVSFIGSHVLIATATLDVDEFQEVLTELEYQSFKPAAPSSSTVTIQDLENVGISIAQEDSNV